MKKLHVRVPKVFKRKRVWIALGVLAVLAGGAWYLGTKTLSGPAIGTVVTSATPNTSESKPELEQLDGKYFSFIHPMTLVEQQVKQQAGTDTIESHTLLTTGMTGEYLVAVVSKLPPSGLDDVSGYIMRQQDPKKFPKIILTIQGEQVTVFTNDDGQQLQQVAFWPHQDKLLTFSLTGMSGDADSAHSEFSDMVKSIKWR